MVGSRILVCFLIVGGIYAEDIVRFSRAKMCNDTVVLGTKHHASIIDFPVSSLFLEPNSHVCNLYVETTNTPYIGMKFLSSDIDVAYSNAYQCSFKLSITGKDMEQMHYNTLPESEININTYGYVSINIILDKCIDNTNNSSLFRVLIFTHGDTFCFSEEIHCINSTRCVHQELACNTVYDFCDNDFKNCQRKSDISTYKRYRRRGPLSIPGIALGVTSLTLLVTLLVYLILCRNRPCCKRITQKLQCRLQTCRSCGGRTTESSTATARSIPEIDDVCSLHYTYFRDLPPSYCDLQPSQHGQGDTHLQFETGRGLQNIPPPLYHHEDTDTTNVLNDLPPPYSVVSPPTEGLHHM